MEGRRLSNKEKRRFGVSNKARWEQRKTGNKAKRRMVKEAQKKLIG